MKKIKQKPKLLDVGGKILFLDIPSFIIYYVT